MNYILSILHILNNVCIYISLLFMLIFMYIFSEKLSLEKSTPIHTHASLCYGYHYCIHATKLELRFCGSSYPSKKKYK